MKVNFLISDEFYKDDQTFIISNDGSATGSGLMKWFSPFIWRNTFYVVDYNANIHRLNNKSKLKSRKYFEADCVSGANFI